MRSFLSCPSLTLWLTAERGYWVLREAIQNFSVPEGNTFGSAAATGSDNSDLIRDFIQQCLCTDPAQRPSAEDLLKHPYIVRAVQRGVVSADGSRPPRLRACLVQRAPATSAEVDDVVDHIVQWCVALVASCYSPLSCSLSLQAAVPPERERPGRAGRRDPFPRAAQS